MLYKSGRKYICGLLLFSHSVVSDFGGSHGLQHARFPCPSLSAWVCSDSCSLSQWWHPIIFSITPFSYPQSFPAWDLFPMSLYYASDGQSIGASASVLPKNTQSWFPLRLTDMISLLSKRLSSLFSSTTILKASVFSNVLQCSAWFMVQFSHLSMTTGKTIALTIQTFVDKVMSLYLNMLSGLSGVSAS